MNFNIISINLNTIRTIFIIIATEITLFKIINDKNYFTNRKILGYICLILTILIIGNIKGKINPVVSTVFFTFLLAIIFSVSIRISIGNTLLVTLISLAVNYVIYFVAIIIVFFINKILFAIQKDIINFILIILFHISALVFLFRLKRFKNGIVTLQKTLNNMYMDMIIINISLGIFLIVLIFSNIEILLIKNALFIFIIFCILMFITIQKSLQLYYKQKLLVQELEETKKELENKKEELQNVEKENINISKKNHTLAHKQKSLEHKIEEMINKSEVSKEEAEELKSRLKEIGKDLYKEKETIELDKTGIPEIDDMMKYMQSECKKNKIEFEYQLKGNIYYMTNNLVSKEDLETLLADHIKNAIIAINHTNNLNRSILVRLGKIDENYGLYIYDSGIEFKPEIFEKLGKEPSTTHPDEGGTGMGFMNTFDTLRKYNASLTIEEYDKPNKDNYTKVLIIKFDGKKEFKIKSYQLKETIKIG